MTTILSRLNWKQIVLASYRFLFHNFKIRSFIAEWVLPFNIEVFLSLKLRICDLLEAWSPMIYSFIRISMSIEVFFGPVIARKFGHGFLLIDDSLHFNAKKIPSLHNQISLYVRLAVSHFLCPQIWVVYKYTRIVTNCVSRFIKGGDVPTRYESCGTYLGVRKILSLNFAGGTKTFKIFSNLGGGQKLVNSCPFFWG